MSRAAAATTANQVHLIVKKAAGSDKTHSLMVSSMPYDRRSTTLSRGGFQVFLLFHKYLRNTTGVLFKKKRIPNVVLQHVFHFLFNGKLHPQSLRELDLKNALLPSWSFISMRDSNTTSANHVHSYFYKYKLQCLLNAALNADLETVNRILEKTKPEQRHILLSAVGCATITHLNRSFALSEFAPQDIATLSSIITTDIASLSNELKEIFQQDQWSNNYKSIEFTTQQVDELKAFLDKKNLSAKLLLNIERTGTPLQMALYGHDEEMAAAIKSHMDPAEFQRQWEAVFGLDYSAFLERQQQDANDLCDKLYRAFRAVEPIGVTNTAGRFDDAHELNYVPNATPALQNTLNRFKDKLEQYVRENRVHNPYILQRLFEIYDSPICKDWDKDFLLSQQAIGVAQKLSSPRWLQHLSEGIYNLAESNEPASRLFRLHGSHTVDIRKLDQLGVDTCIDICGNWHRRAGLLGKPIFMSEESGHTVWRRVCGWNYRLQNFYQAKTASFQNIILSMRRAANQVHLIVKKAAGSDKTNSLMVSSMPYDGRSITLSREEFQVFLLFHKYLRNTTNILFKKKPIPDRALQHIFHFLFNGMLQSTSLRLSSLSESKLRNAILPPRSFFLMQDSSTTTANRIRSCFYEYKLKCLLNATLNADLETVNRILEKSKPEQRHILLSAVGRATITHLNIERTGTPLQMALYGHDEEMAAAIKSHMDPAEFQRQWEAVFGPNYYIFLARQQHDANNLCGELYVEIHAASPLDVINARNRVANTTSKLQNTLNRFKDKLELYVRENRVHNPYILQHLFEIYDSPTFNDWNKDCLLSQQAIGVAQKLSSLRWLQHWSQGIYYLAENNEPARRSFDLRDSLPAVDIRSLDQLGVDSCIHILALSWQNARRGGPVADRLQNLCRAKTASFENIMRPERSCCLIQ